MNSIGVLFTITVFFTAHTLITKMFKETVTKEPEPTIPRSKWIQ